MKKLTILIMLLPVFGAMAQIAISDQVQTLNGKKYYVHIVGEGQTVYSISRAYGVKDYEAVLKTDIHHISVGDTIWLPYKGQTVVEEAKSYHYVKVEPGQTLYSLSKAYGMTVEDIYELNPDVKANGLKAGQMVKVAGAGDSKTDSKSEAKPAATQTKPATQPAKQGRTPAQYTPKPPAAPAVIRPLTEAGKVHVSLMMPLHLADLDKISTTKFDLDQRGKKNYGAFEYIQFYEGLLMGLERLERTGCKVVLNVVDVSGTTTQDVTTAFNTHHVAESDILFALLPRQQFEQAANLAQQNQLFIVNPLSERSEIVEGNPYVFKCMPSMEGQVRSLLKMIEHNTAKPHLYIVHSGSRNEARMRDVLEKELKANGKVEYTFFDWSANSKLPATLKKTPNCVVLNIYDQNKDKNHIQISTLLNRLIMVKTGVTLVSMENYLNKFSDLDFMQLDHANYTTIYTEIDFSDPDKKAFADLYRAEFKTEPQGLYAASGNDLMIYFASGLSQRGTEFFKNPVMSKPAGMVYGLNFKQSDPGHGFENETAHFYKLSNYHFVPAQGRR